MSRRPGRRRPPPGPRATLSIDYTASAGWTVLRKKEKPAAEIFSVSYVAQPGGDRPVTFVFNGGPGASSAFLHMGAVGPVRVAFPADGTLPPMPPRLVPNEESWLAFTDLVFVDPVGTGFSRVIEDDSKDGDEKQQAERGEDGDAQGVLRLQARSRVAVRVHGRWLSGHGRWGSAVFIAGESYGGYRVGRLVRMLQETDGDRAERRDPDLAGAGVRVAARRPTTTCSGGSMSCRRWRSPPCTTGARARSRPTRTFDDVLREAERFATGDYATLLTRGASMPAAERDRILGALRRPDRPPGRDGRARRGPHHDRTFHA